MSTWGRLTCSICLAVTAAFMLGAQTAAASTVERVTGFPISNDHSLIVADSTGDAPGELNLVKVGLAPEFPDDYRITDAAGINGPLPSFCVRESGTSIRCNRIAVFPSVDEPTEVTRIFVRLGGGDDGFEVLDPRGIPEGVLLEVWGGPGNDTIWGRKGGGMEKLVGDGEDENGGPQGPFGNDTLITGAPEDGKELSGGGGNDVIVIIVNNQARGFLTATTPALASKGSAGARMFGEAGKDRLTGGPGNDKIKGGPGRDRIKGRGGNDIIDCGAGKGDVGIGGPGRDLGRRCEKVKH
jgi:hypothetical protein